MYLGGGDTSGNNEHWTLSFWFKKGMSLPSGTSQVFLAAGNGSSGVNSDNLLRIGLIRPK